jgi:hypothetical protein
MLGVLWMRIQIEKSQIEVTPTWHKFFGVIKNWFSPKPEAQRAVHDLENHNAS